MEKQERSRMGALLLCIDDGVLLLAAAAPPRADVCVLSYPAACDGSDA
jgi:hypothetical protein